MINLHVVSYFIRVEELVAKNTCREISFGDSTEHYFLLSIALCKTKNLGYRDDFRRM